MGASPGLLLAHLMVSFVAVHYFCAQTLFIQKKKAVFAAVAPMPLLALPVFSECPTGSVIAAISVVAGWLALCVLTRLKANTNLACIVIIVALAGVWFGTYGLAKDQELVPIIITTVASISCVGLHVTSKI